MWLINGHTVVSGSRYKLTYDGMYHMDIPKTRQYDTGKIEVIARSSVGESIAETELKVIPRHDDYRNVLKNSPRRKYSRTLFLKLIRAGTGLTLFKMPRLTTKSYFTQCTNLTKQAKHIRSNTQFLNFLVYLNYSLVVNQQT